MDPESWDISWKKKIVEPLKTLVACCRDLLRIHVLIQDILQALNRTRLGNTLVFRALCSWMGESVLVRKGMVLPAWLLL